MNYIIIDMEFNNLKNITEYNADFYKDYPNLDEKIKKCPNEIIEVGAVKLDKQLRPLDQLKLYIKPSIFPVLNPKIKLLTHITEEDLLKGCSFLEAMHKFRSFIDEESVICSWSKNDICELIRNAAYYDYYNISWINSYMDLQEYFAKVLASKRVPSLKSALKLLNIKIDEKKLHDGLNDAIYTAEVFRRRFNYKAVQSCVIKDIDQMPLVPIEIDDSFCLDKNKVGKQCPNCNGKLTVEIPLKASNGKFKAVGYCKHCEINVLQEVVIKRNLAGELIYHNSNKILDEEKYRDIV